MAEQHSNQHSNQHSEHQASVSIASSPALNPALAVPIPVPVDVPVAVTIDDLMRIISESQALNVNVTSTSNQTAAPTTTSSTPTNTASAAETTANNNEPTTPNTNLTNLLEGLAPTINNLTDVMSPVFQELAVETQRTREECINNNIPVNHLGSLGALSALMSCMPISTDDHNPTAGLMDRIRNGDHAAIEEYKVIRRQQFEMELDEQVRVISNINIMDGFRNMMTMFLNPATTTTTPSTTTTTNPPTNTDELD